MMQIFACLHYEGVKHDNNKQNNLSGIPNKQQDFQG